MPRYVALLRAINVGKRIVKMDHLRGLFEELGFRDVETVIASGNVLFDTSSRSGAAIEKKIEQHLAKRLGYDVDTFVRTPAELVAIAERRLFTGSPQYAETNTLYVGFLKTTPAAEASGRLMGLQTDIDEFRVSDREYYWSCRKSIGQSTLTGAMIERALGAASTVRNITTVQRLAGG